MEVQIGSDEPIGPSVAHRALLRESPNIATAAVVAHMQRVRHHLANPPGNVDDTLKWIREVTDCCDQLFYWAIAESHFPESDSVLAECSVLDSVIEMLRHGRPAIAAAALQVLQPMLLHNASRKRFACSPDVLPVLCRLVSSFPRKEEIVVGVITVGQALAGEMLEAVLSSDLISSVLGVMQASIRAVPIQLASCKLFATLIAQPRQSANAPPVASLFVHVGCIVQFLLDAFNAHPTNSELCASVATCLQAMSTNPPDRDVLGSLDVIGCASRMLRNNIHAPPIANACLVALANMMDQADKLQKRSIVLLVQTVMTRQCHLQTLASCCALCYVILTTFASPKNQPSQDDAERQKQVELLEMKIFMTDAIAPIVSLAQQVYGDSDTALKRAADECLGALAILPWERSLA